MFVCNCHSWPLTCEMNVTVSCFMHTMDVQTAGALMFSGLSVYTHELLARVTHFCDIFLSEPIFSGKLLRVRLYFIHQDLIGHDNYIRILLVEFANACIAITNTHTMS